MKKLSKFITDNLHWLIVAGVAVLCAVFLICGTESDSGYITLDGSDATISDSTKQFIEDANAALYRITEQDAPTDEETIEANDEVGLGGATTLDEVLARRLPDGHNDDGNGWQCSRYTAYLATGKWSYSTSHPDYGPVNGKDVAAWLVNNYGWKYIDEPVKGAIGSGNFNTKYGHTAMFLYSTGTNTAMVNDANAKPLTVSTWNMNISGWVWVVPGTYEPSEPTPTPEPTPEPTPVSSTCNSIGDTYNVSAGDTLGYIMKHCEGYIDWSYMNEYAQSWTSNVTGTTIYHGWHSESGVGLHAGAVITRIK